MIRYLNLPRIPEDIIAKINFNFDQYEKKVSGVTYTWSDSFNAEVNQWCRENICQDMYWAFQIMTGDLPVHKDRVTETKLLYLLQTGGNEVTTYFLDDDQKTVTQNYVIEPHRWHILRANAYHGVKNITGVRFSITGRVFPE